MNHFFDYLYIAEYIGPVFSAISCAVLLLLSYENSHTHTEVKVKRTTILYLCAGAFSWTGAFIYIYFPEAFVIIQAPVYLSMLLTQVLFYQLFHILTSLKDKEPFNIWHYLIPVIICGALIVWSFFIPYNIQLEIVMGKGKAMPEGYEAYTRFFMSKMGMRVTYCIVYMTLTTLRLIQYYKTINQSPSLVRKPAKWVFMLALLTITSVIVSTVGAFMRSAGLYRSLLAAIASMAVFAQHVLLTYHIVQRGYMLYITFPGRKHIALKPDTEEVTESKQGLTRKSFESYIKTHKPYLNPSIKLTDLVDELETNRSYLSNFINNTYGINFKRYINRCLLKELERLMKKPSNKGKSASELITKVGFSGLRHYDRSVAAESDDSTTNTIPKKEE